MTDVMMAIAILLPVVAGLIIFAVRSYMARGAVVVLTALILIVNSILMLKRGPFEYTPTGFDWGLLITILDYVILLFYIYLGLTLRNWLVLIFSLTQLIPLAYFEFIMKAHVEVKPAFVVDNLAHCHDAGDLHRGLGSSASTPSATCTITSITLTCKSPGSPGSFCGWCSSWAP